MNRLVAIISTIVLSVASATAGIRLYCDTTPAIPGLTIQGTPDYSTSYSYDLNGNPTQIYRKGIAHKYASGSNRQWQYDEIDNLYIDYRGNQDYISILRNMKKAAVQYELRLLCK